MRKLIHITLQTMMAMVMGIGFVALAPGSLMAQYTFPDTYNGTVGNSWVDLDLTEAGVPPGTYLDYTVTVDWSNSFDAYSSEANIDMNFGALVPQSAPTTGANTNGDPTTLTWTGSFTAPYTAGDPITLGMYQTWSGSTANWNNVTVSITAAPPSESATYTAGDIPTNYSSYSATCNGPLTTLDVPLPAGGPYEVTSVTVAYDMTAANGAYMSEQRSQIYCQNTSTGEGGYVSGAGDSEGTYGYSRSGLNLANGIYGGGTNLTFEMRAYRTWGGTLCDTQYNKVDDGTWTITVFYEAVPACTGTPDPGNTIASESSVCSGVTVDLSLENEVDDDGITIQWQSSPSGAGTWTDFGADADTETATITADTDFRAQVTCAGNTGTSTPVTVLLNTDACACVPLSCIPSGGDNLVEYTSNVTFAGINNTTGQEADAYGDYRCDTPGEVTQGQTYSFSGTVEVSNLYGGDENYTVFIDWNQDGDFEDVGETYEVGSCATTPACTVTGDIEVPETALTGSTAMRVIVRWNTSPTDPCLAPVYGEVEDYLVNVTEATCSSPTVSETITEDCGASTFDITIDIAADGDATDYDVSYDDGGGSVSVGTYTGGTTGIAVGTFAFGTTVDVTVAHNDDAACDQTLSGLTFTSCPDPYCEAGAGSTCCEKIENLTFNTISDLGNTTTDTYVDETALSTDIAQNQTYAFSADAGSFSSYADDQVFVWIDWNQNDVLDDAGELVLTTPTSTGPWTGNITVPAGALTGPTRMRVRLHDSGLGPNSTPCGDSDYGQVRDYTVNVVAPSCAAPTVSETITENCGASTFDITIDIAADGDATDYDVSYDDGGGSTVVGTYTGGTTGIAVGTFAFGTSVDVTVAHNDDATCDQTLSGLTFAGCPPANDDCTNATALTVDGGVVSGDNTLATVDGPAMACAFGSDPVQNDVWFSFVAPMSGTIEIETSTGSNGDTQMQVLDACGGTVVDCDDDDGTGLYSLIVLECADYVGGNTYFVQVDGYDGEQGDFGIEVRTVAVDGCTDPEAINYDPCATNDDESCEYPISSCGPDTYSYCYDENDLDARFYYEAESGSDLYIQLNSGYVESGFSDYDFFRVWDNFDASGTPLYEVSGDLAAGTILHSTTGELMIQVTSDVSNNCDDQSYDPVNYTIRCDAPAANSDCGSVQNLSVATYPATSNSLGSLGFLEASPDAVCDGNPGANLYYSFNVTEINTFIVNVNPFGGSDIVVEVLDACGGTSLACVNDNGAGGSESALLESLDVGTYIVRIHNASGDPETLGSGNFLVNVQQLPFAGVQDNPNNPLYACGQTGFQLEDFVGATPQTTPGVLDYEWLVAEVNGGTQTTYQRGYANYVARCEWLGMEYGKTYNTFVRVLWNLPVHGPTWSVYKGDFQNPNDIGASDCTIATSFNVTQTELLPNYIETNAQGNPYALCDFAIAYNVQGSENFRWRFDTDLDPNSGNEIYYTRGTGNPSVRLNWVSGLVPGTTYNVAVEVQVSGEWSGYGTDHEIDLALTPNDVVIRPQFCGGTYSPNGYIMSQSVCDADLYQFRFTPSGGGTPSYRNSGNYVCFMSGANPSLTPGDYDVQVKVVQNGVPGDWGPVCAITISGPQGQSNETPALRDIEAQGGAMLFPNPNAGEEVRVNLDGLSDGNHEVMIQVYDVYGKLIINDGFGHEGNSLSRLVRFDGDMATGMYMVQITVDGERFATERLIVK